MDTKTVSLYRVMGLVLLCTVFTAIGQLFWKIGAKSVISTSSFLFNPFVLAGFVMYGIGALLFIIALSKAELSLLYPLVSASFIWALLLSWIFLDEALSVQKLSGILFIIIGFAFLGRGAKT